MCDLIKKTGRFLMITFFVCYAFFSWMEKPAAAAETGQQEEETLSLNARAAVLMDADSGRILYGKNETMVLPMASTTKIMTLIVALEQNEPAQIVTASARAAAMPKVRLGVCEGERYRMEDLYYAMMLESFNDAAMMIAEGSAGSAENFAALMNEKAASLGCTQTYFITPNGLDAADGRGVHSSTAADMARIMRYAIDNEEFLKITRTADHSFTDCDGKRSFTVHNKNALLTMMEGVLSGKTGYTADAGYCYVCAVQKGERTFIAALLGSGWPPHKTYKWMDVQTLLSYGDKNYNYQTVDISKEVSKIQLHVTGGEQKFIWISPEQTRFSVLLSEKDQIGISSLMPGQIKAPVENQHQIGWIYLTVNGFPAAKTQYVTTEEAAEKRGGLNWLLRK